MIERMPSPLAPALPIRIVDGRRNWASGRVPSLLERVAAWTGAHDARYPLYRIRAAVVDADVLIKEVLASVRRGYPVTLIELGEIGALRLYATRSVIGEVGDKLAVAAAEVKVHPSAAAAQWNELAQAIRVVDVDSARAETLTLRDPKDGPTAYLSAIVGTRWTWSNDRDLGDVRLATPYALDVALRIRAASAREREFYATVSVSVGALELSLQAARGLWSLASRYPLLAFALGAGLALVTERSVTKHAGIASFIRNAWNATESSRAAARARWDEYGQLLDAIPALEGPDPELPLELAVGRALAGAPVALSVEEIRARIGERPGTSVPAIRDALRSPIFVRTAVGRWQLGCW